MKYALTHVLRLALPTSSEHFEVIYDASIVNISVSFKEKGKPIAFESQEIFFVKIFYTIGDQDFITIMYALYIWHCYLEGANCVEVTNYNPFIYLNHNKYCRGVMPDII